MSGTRLFVRRAFLSKIDRTRDFLCIVDHVEHLVRRYISVTLFVWAGISSQHDAVDSEDIDVIWIHQEPVTEE